MYQISRNPAQFDLQCAAKVAQMEGLAQVSTASLNVTVIEKRMLRENEAAIYIGLAVKHFKADCRVRPIELRAGAKLWDKCDLDQWIDAQKSGAETFTHENILRRLK